MIRRPFPTGVRTHVESAAQDDAGDTGLARLWALRLLVVGGGYAGFVDGDGEIRDLALAHWLGLEADRPRQASRRLDAGFDDLEVWELQDDENGADSPEGDELSSHIRNRRRKRVDELHACLRQAEGNCALVANSPILAKTRQLARVCGLPPGAAEVLAFFALMADMRQQLHAAAQCLSPRSETEVAQALAAALNMSEGEARAAIAADGPLLRAGLLCRQAMPDSLAEWFAISLPDLSDHLLDHESAMESWLSSLVVESPAGKLRAGDYRHLGQDTELAQAILARALEQRRKGANVLFHGLPGTGKSELARLLARRLDTQLFCVAHSRPDTALPTVRKRLAGLQAAQRLLAGRPALILMDDADDICASAGVPVDEPARFGRRQQDTLSFAGLVGLLHDTPTPTVWVAHDISAWPVALLRHFDLVLEVTRPPFEQMFAWLREYAGDLLSHDAMERLIDLRWATPGLIANAIDRIRELLVNGWLPAGAHTAETLIRGMLKMPQKR